MSNGMKTLDFCTLRTQWLLDRCFKIPANSSRDFIASLRRCTSKFGESRVSDANRCIPMRQLLPDVRPLILSSRVPQREASQSRYQPSSL